MCIMQSSLTTKYGKCPSEPTVDAYGPNSGDTIIIYGSKVIISGGFFLFFFFLLFFFKCDKTSELDCSREMELR
jgi:hypothetical protein